MAAIATMAGWVPIAQTFVGHFGLKPGDRVASIVGCAQGVFWSRTYAMGVRGSRSMASIFRNTRSPMPIVDVAGSPDARIPAMPCLFDDHGVSMPSICNQYHPQFSRPARCAQRDTRAAAGCRREGVFIQVDAYRSAAERQLFEGLDADRKRRITAGSLGSRCFASSGLHR